MLRFTGNNIGIMLSRSDVTWGWFEGGFDLTQTNPNGTTGCLRSTHSKIVKVTDRDYSPHHEHFQYYKETANLRHVRPTSVQMIGHNGDAANHQYDIDDFFQAKAIWEEMRDLQLKADDLLAQADAESLSDDRAALVQSAQDWYGKFNFLDAVRFLEAALA